MKRVVYTFTVLPYFARASGSVMPTVPGGNTMIPAIMVGEKAADLIRGRSLPAAELPA